MTLSSFLVLLYRKTSRHCSAEGCILTQEVGEGGMLDGAMMM